MPLSDANREREAVDDDEVVRLAVKFTVLELERVCGSEYEVRAILEDRLGDDVADRVRDTVVVGGVVMRYQRIQVPPALSNLLLSLFHIEIGVPALTDLGVA